MRKVDARLALVRHVVAGEYEPPRVSPLQRRKSQAEAMRAWSETLHPITDATREQYTYEFDERVSVYVYAGLPERCGSKVYAGGECCARHLALDDLGCVEYWAYAGALLFVRGLVSPIPTPLSEGHCTRCESVGHVVASCPFPPGDVGVLKVARLRRERRAQREAAA